MKNIFYKKIHYNEKKKVSSPSWVAKFTHRKITDGFDWNKALMAYRIPNTIQIFKRTNKINFI